MECLGFGKNHIRNFIHGSIFVHLGWIERYDNQKQNYEIYTPIASLETINMLVSGAFDTPDEFEHMFKRVIIE